MNDLDYDSARIVEEIQQGLKHLDEEEENLVVLRDQLTKVKRFREEQARKDDMIATLQERMRQLEYEKEFGTQQSAELEEIMSERILTLERSLAERDEVEKQFLEFQVQAEVIEMERDSLKAELHNERESHDQTRMECTDLVNKIHRLQAALENDQQVALKTHMLFEALKTELHKKETELSIQATKRKECTRQFKQDLAVARKAVEDMAEQLILLEEAKVSAENSLLRAKSELGSANQEAAQCQGEVARWASMYAELEKVLSSLKAQISTAQFSHASEVNSLQTESARLKQDVEKLHAELSACTSTLSAVINDMCSITSLHPPTSLTQLHHYRSEVVAIVRSMKRFVSKLPDSVPHNTAFRQIAACCDDLTHRAMSYQEALFQSTSTGAQDAQRAVELDNRLTRAERELSIGDAAAEGLLQMFQKDGFVPAALDEHRQRESEEHKSVGGAAGNGKNTVRVESLNGEYRTKLHEALRLATTTHDSQSLHAKETLHHTELRDLTEALRALQTKYNTEMEHMHRMNEEALVAVRVAEFESGSEVTRLREEFHSKNRHDTSDRDEQVRSLQAEAQVHIQHHEQAVLCLNHLLVYTAQLETRYDRLYNVYQTVTHVQRKDEKVIRGLDSLVSCCHPQHRDHSATRKSHDFFQFEPFLDPLEEITTSSRAKITFRVAVLHVLAALRFRNVMRESRAHKTNRGLNTLQSGVQLPHLFVLQDSGASSEQIAHMLLHAARTGSNSGNTSNTPGQRGGGAVNRIPLHQEMSMDEFDAYLAHYEREHRSPTRAGSSGGGSSRAADRPTLLQTLGSPLRSSSSSRSSMSHTSSGSISQLHTVSVLYKTLCDMSSTISKDRAELQQLQGIITSLEDHVRSQEKTLAQQHEHISQARELESHLRHLISELERDKRSKSYHLLREIQDELKQDFATMPAVPPVQKYVPLGVTYPQYRTQHSDVDGDGRVHDAHAAAHASHTHSTSPPRTTRPHEHSVDSVGVQHAPTHSSPRRSPNTSGVNSGSSRNATDSRTTTHYSNTSITTTPPRSHKLPTSWTETPVQNPVDRDITFEYTPMEAPHTALHRTSPLSYVQPAHESFEYSELQDFSVLDQTVDSLLSGALYPPPADISWGANDSYHTHFTGTDKDIHVSPGYSAAGSGGGSGDRGRGGGSSASVPDSKLSREGSDRGGVPRYESYRSTHTTTNKSVYNSHIPMRTTQSPARAEREATQNAHNDEIHAIYSDIGRLGGRLTTKLRTASPSSSSSQTGSSSGAGVYSKYSSVVGSRK